MNHNVYGKKLSRNTDERKRLIKNLLKSLIIHGSITTSKAKAQAIRGTIDKLITKAKKGTDAAKRYLYGELSDRQTAKLLMDMAATRFTARTSGYTSMIKVGKRQGDASEQVLLRFVDEAVTAEVVQVEKPKKVKSTETKKVEVPKKEKTEPVTKEKRAKRSAPKKDK